MVAVSIRLVIRQESRHCSTGFLVNIHPEVLLVINAHGGEFIDPVVDELFRFHGFQQGQLF
mgnify:CR=1 FL=1